MTRNFTRNYAETVPRCSALISAEFRELFESNNESSLGVVSHQFTIFYGNNPFA